MYRLYRLCRPSSFVSSQSSISYKLSAVSYRLSSIVCRVSLVAYRPPLQPIADRRYRRYRSSLSFKVESIIPAFNTNRSQLDNSTVSLGMSMNDDSGLVKKVAQFLTLSLSEPPLGSSNDVRDTGGKNHPFQHSPPPLPGRPQPMGK